MSARLQRDGHRFLSIFYLFFNPVLGKIAPSVLYGEAASGIRIIYPVPSTGKSRKCLCSYPKILKQLPFCLKYGTNLYVVYYCPGRQKQSKKRVPRSSTFPERGGTCCALPRSENAENSLSLLLPPSRIRRESESFSTPSGRDPRCSRFAAVLRFHK